MTRNYAIERKLLDVALQNLPPPPDVQRVVLPLPPSVNRLWYEEVKFDRGGNHKVHRRRTQEYHEYKRAVQEECLVQHLKCHQHSTRLALTKQFYRTSGGRGDLDNYNKALLDSLNGVAWVDDDQIVESHDYLLEGSNPCVVLYVCVAGVQPVREEN